jgi:hypothetical protein
VVLLGRGSECAALDRLLGAVRAGQSAALVVRGEQPQRDALAVAFGPS